MLLTATLLGIPWWVSVSGYFVIGTLWACFYLPRRVKLMARAYHAWRKETLEDRSLAEVLGPETEYRSRLLRISPAEFRRCRDRDDWSEQRLIASFIANIAFWPIRVPQKILTDYLVEFWLSVFRWLRVVFRLVRNAISAVWRVLRNFITWLYRHVQTLYQAIILRANREAIADLKKLEGR
ncbi:hypothetical protein AB4Y45_33230 [Paraburkholderia sp. EG287A]|uniref:hypothetical protein n=1 Tax=Paraburkholderia sp. EG287A TaxID=3237012 RepID=UPI0034D308CF